MFLADEVKVMLGVATVIEKAEVEVLEGEGENYGKEPEWGARDAGRAMTPVLHRSRILSCKIYRTSQSITLFSHSSSGPVGRLAG